MSAQSSYEALLLGLGPGERKCKECMKFWGRSPYACALSPEQTRPFSTHNPNALACSRIDPRLTDGSEEEWYRLRDQKAARDQELARDPLFLSDFLAVVFVFTVDTENRIVKERKDVARFLTGLDLHQFERKSFRCYSGPWVKGRSGRLSWVDFRTVPERIEELIRGVQVKDPGARKALVNEALESLIHRGFLAEPKGANFFIVAPKAKKLTVLFTDHEIYYLRHIARRFGARMYSRRVIDPSKA